MGPEVREMVLSKAKCLIDLGFVQALTKPYLFLCGTTEGTIFADLGGARDVPIWEETSVLLYDNLRGTINFKREIMARLYEALESNGVCSRFSFYGMYYRPQKEDPLPTREIESGTR